MQSYIDFAAKNNLELLEEGNCQFCGAGTKRGVHECVEIFSLGFKSVDFSLPKNYFYRFLVVDAHTLQHSELHGRWSNHFHLTRLHLIFKYNVIWTYKLSPKLSETLNQYKLKREEEYLLSPKVLERGKITSVDVLNVSYNQGACKHKIEEWAKEVYFVWGDYHKMVDKIAQEFLNLKL
ncbi:DUF5946 family protein [Wenyingzhuangia sp. IMCC45574]